MSRIVRIVIGLARTCIRCPRVRVRRTVLRGSEAQMKKESVAPDPMLLERQFKLLVSDLLVAPALREPNLVVP